MQKKSGIIKVEPKCLSKGKYLQNYYTKEVKFKGLGEQHPHFSEGFLLGHLQV